MKKKHGKNYSNAAASFGKVKAPKRFEVFTRKGGDIIARKRRPYKKSPTETKGPAFEIFYTRHDEVWSIDFAYVNKLAENNNGVNYPLVAADVLSRYLSVLPMRTKSTQQTPHFSRKRLKKRNVRKVGWIEVQKTNVYSRQLAIEEEFTRRKQSETESAFGERKIRFAKTCLCNKLEHK